MRGTDPERWQPDGLDQRLIALLRRDGRMPYRALAGELDITEATVRTRVRRLEDSGYMRVVAVTDYAAAGYGMMVSLGIQVEGRAADRVADELAAIPEVFSVCQVVGAQDLEALLVARDPQQLTDLLTGRLAAVPGVRRLLPALAMDVLKNQPHWVPLKAAFAASLGPAEAAGDEQALDRLDRQILDWLSMDARTSNRRIAGAVGVTEGTVRTRIRRMEAAGQIRLTAVTNIEHLVNPVLAYVWIEVERSDQAQAVARRLAEVPEVGFVGLMLGRSDSLAITMVHDTEQLSRLLQTTLSVIPGVRRAECSLGVRLIKHDYRISRIVPEPSEAMAEG